MSATPDSAPTPSSRAAGAARRALLVDDEPVIRRALRRFLERDGWAIDEAEDGERAVGLLLGDGAPDYDVILSDLQMPNMSGEQLYDLVAARRPAMAARVIVTTGDAFGPAATRFLSRTGCAVLNKPFELAELRAVVERVAGRA